MMHNASTNARQKQALLAFVAAALSLAAIARTAHAANAYGCLFDGSVCSSVEICADDGVFGVCRGPGDPSEWSELPNGDPSTRLLEAELARLWAEGYRWSDDYTQCVVRQLLHRNSLSAAQQEPFAKSRSSLDSARTAEAADGDALTPLLLYDPGYCAHALKSNLPVISDDVAAQLSNVDPADQAFIRFTPDLPTGGESDGLPVRSSGSAAAAGTFADEVFVPPTASATPPSAEDHDPEGELRRLEALSRATNLDTTNLNGQPAARRFSGDVVLGQQQQQQQQRQQQQQQQQQQQRHGARTSSYASQMASRQQAAADRLMMNGPEVIEDNRFAQDIQDNLWRGNNPYDSSYFLDEQNDDHAVEDDGIEINGNEPILGVSKRSPSDHATADSLLWDDRQVDQLAADTTNLAELVEFLQRYEQTLADQQQQGDTRYSESEIALEGDLRDDGGEEEAAAAAAAAARRIMAGAGGFPMEELNGELLSGRGRPYIEVDDESEIDDQNESNPHPPLRRSSLRRRDNDNEDNGEDENLGGGGGGDEDDDVEEEANADPRSDGGRAESSLRMLMATAPDNSDFVGDLRIRADPFIRLMRLDTKKPGPGYFIHERDESEDEQEYLKNMRRLEAKMQMLTRNEFVDGDELIEALNELGVADQNGQKREVEVAGVPPSRVPERHAAGVAPLDPYNTERGVEAVDSNTAYVVIKNVQTGEVNHGDARLVASTLEKMFGLPTGTISQLQLNGSQVSFKLLPNEKGLNASEMIRQIDEVSGDILRATNLSISSAGIGEKVKYELISPRSGDLFLFTFVVCGSVVGVLLAISVIYVVRRHQLSKDKLHGLNGEDDPLAKFDYQDLCRQRMADSGSTKEGALAAAMEAGRAPEKGSPKKVKIAAQQSHDSSRSSTSSWSEEPVASNMDISTGHMILSYMEDHLKSKNRLDEEWEGLCAYEADPCSTTQAEKEENVKKNRYTHALPYDHARVILNESSNAGNSDYINASAITDHDPRNPAYIATQGPLPHTASDFWQMVWEQGSVVIVTLTRLMENGVAMCHRYWPEEGSEVYSLYEVHLVSEHIWCDDYLVRSFYLKNLNTSETRTVTQFHFLSWPEAGVPPSAKALLDFRRKVNKSYRGRSCPIVVHCSDGSGRTGTYILADMVLNRIAKGAKEIDVAATLEHVRDQRANMVRTKAQFEFVLMAIAEEVHAILKALSKE